MKYNKNKFSTLVDLILDEDNGDLTLRKEAIQELKSNALTADVLNKIKRSERLYGSIPSDISDFVGFKIKQRTEDVATMLVEAGGRLNISNLNDFCLYLGIPADSSYDAIVDKAHVVVRSNRVHQPRSIYIA